MGVSEEWRGIKYQETFDEEIRGLTRRRQLDSNFHKEELEAALNNMYIMDGADHGGRGCLQDIVMAARIAAYEHFIAEWK